MAVRNTSLNLYETTQVLIEGAIQPWASFPSFLAANVIAKEPVIVGAKGEYTETGLAEIRDFLGLR